MIWNPRLAQKYFQVSGVYKLQSRQHSSVVISCTDKKGPSAEEEPCAERTTSHAEHIGLAD
jgi:hypothetical protein